MHVNGTKLTVQNALHGKTQTHCKCNSVKNERMTNALQMHVNTHAELHTECRECNVNNQLKQEHLNTGKGDPRNTKAV